MTRMETPFPNQPPPYEGRNLYLTDAALRDAVAREGAAHAEATLAQWGAMLARPETYALADAANRNPPVLRTHDRRGERIDAVDFHPAWDALMGLAAVAGEHCAPWAAPGTGAQAARAAMYFLHAQVENGTQCPLTMTYASVPVLARHRADLPDGDRWLQRVLTADHDPRPLPVSDKRAALIGMGMTERQGGSDVRANLSHADPARDGGWRIHGHKWFFSAPQCDAHLVLAQADAGLTCFLLPRMLPDGTRNAVRLNRLKDKLGNRSNASAEVEFDGALAYAVGAPGRGIATILEMVQHTRLDCAIGSAGMMRGALAWALHHASHRVAFGRLLIEQPLMLSVLADLALEVEGATALAMRLARAFDAPADAADRALARVATPAAKYWTCKRAPAVAFEAMEVLGGGGYVEDTPLPRLYREAPVNSIWEGSGNVICLDVLRAVEREPVAVDALAAELALARGGNADLDRHAQTLLAALSRDAPAPAPHEARRIAQVIATALAAATLVRAAPAFVADAYCASRLAPASYAGAAFGGALASTIDARAIVARARGPG